MKFNIDDIKARLLDILPPKLVRNFYLRPVSIVRLFTRFDSQCAHESYYPEKKRKSSLHIMAEQFWYILIYSEPNYTYFPYGFDVKSRSEIKQYINPIKFKKYREHLLTEISESITLQNKFLFNTLAEYMGVATPPILAITNGDKVLNTKTKQELPIIDFFKQQGDCDLFIKPVIGSFGNKAIHLISSKGIFTANGKNVTLEELTEQLESDRFLIQPTVKQHPEMAEFHPESTNTLRLITIRNEKTGEIEIFPSIARFGIGKSFIDNTSKGGLAVGINHDTGQLKEYGFFRADYGTKVRKHPDSGLTFSNFKIPFFKECVEQALLLHSVLPGLNSVGWDIAIGESGPIFIEGNDRWEITGPQICHGGLKTRYLVYGKSPV